MAHPFSGDDAMITIPRALRRYMPLERWRHPPPTIAVVRLHGIIGRMGPLRAGLSLAGVAGVLERAFRIPDAKAVALSINSPGGAPVQAALIAKRIRSLAEEHKRPVFAFAEDVAASGGYWLLTAADEIFADESSIIGSIGVISAGFGFPDALQRLGVERRVYTAGEHKGALDPFRPEKAEEVEHLKRIQADIHAAFIHQVRSRRDGKLKEASFEELFSGRYWAGRRAVELGLIDAIGDLRTVMRQRYGEKVRLLLVEESRSLWRRWMGPRGAIDGTAEGIAAGLIAGVEERLWWQRYGL